MKAILKSTAVIAFMFATVVSMANESKSYLVKTTNTKSLVFKLENSLGQASVKLMDSESNVIYSENLSGKKNYLKKFDFQKLDSGTYFLNMEDETKKTKYTISITKDEVKILSKEEDNKPLFTKKGDKFYLSLLNKGLKNIDIKVYDSDGRLVFDEATDAFNIQKAFNFESAYEDSYTIVVKDSTDAYYKEIVIED